MLEDVWKYLKWIGDKNHTSNLDKELQASKREELVFLRDEPLVYYPIQNEQPRDHIQAINTKQTV